MRPVLTAAVLALALLAASPARAQEGNPQTEMAKQMVKVLKEELELSEEQTSKITTAIEDGLRDGFRQMMRHMGEEEPDQEKIRKEGEEIRTNILKKIRDNLDEDQKKEFEVLIKEFDTRAGRFERGRNQPGGDATVWLDGEIPTKERLLLKAENVLILSEDEKKVVLPKVDAVITAREKMREAKKDQRRNLSQAVRAKAKEDEVKERLHALRNSQVELEKVLARSEDDLRELLTLDQEARLVAIGILD
ncbi:MAG: hypothetical protein ACAI25_17485 [Planctomycetota bacterium]